MKKKIIFLFVFTMLAWTMLFASAHPTFAAPMSSAVAEIKAQIAEFLNDLSAVKSRFARPAEPGSTEALARLDLLRQFQAKMQTIRTKIANLRSNVPSKSSEPDSFAVAAEPSEFRVTVPSPKRPDELPKPLKDVEITKALKKGDADENVKKVQGFLKDFPEIYPNGPATGFYGDQTEKAVNKFQEKVGIKQTGEVDEKTKEVLNLLLVAGEKKKPPKITDVTPSSGSAGITVTLTGKGFTLENNSIMIRGKIAATGLQSYDNNTQIDFILTSDTPCHAGSKQACPIKVVNANGISNAKPFKLTELVLTPPEIDPVTPPAPSPLPEPTPPPPPPPPAPTDILAPLRSNGLPSGELAYGTGNVMLSLATDENATCKYAATAGIAYASMTLQFATTGGTAHSSTISGLVNGTSYNYYVRCTDSIGNANTDDFVISFNVASPPKPVITSLSPSKGLVGTNVAINGSGFTASGNSVSFARAVAASSLFSADGKTLSFNVPMATTCQIGETCSIFVTNVNGTSNEVAFLRTQSITPVQVVFPNGGENLVQGVDFTLSWTGGTDRVDIILVEEGAVAGSDPSAFIVGWIATSTKPNSTVNWNVKTVCDAAGTVCTPVTPGRYKMMALSEDEVGLLTIWNDAQDIAGNWDLSNNAFTISPSATLTVVVPNGGEIGSQNSAFILCWATIDLKSKNVKIELLKNNASYRTIYSSYAQTAETGAFITNWTIPGDIPEAADYQVKISDATLPTISDTSDKPFSIVAAASSIKVYEPRGDQWNSSIWYSGFDGPVSWYGTNILSKTVNINLWKGGFFYRSLAINVPQSYYWSSLSYTTGWFYRKVGIPADLPTGKDYMVEVVDAGDPSIRGFSGPFAVVQYPSYMTIKGKFTDYVNKTPVITKVQTWDGSYNWYSNLPNSTGEFSIVATTSDILLSRGHSFWAYPPSYDYKYWSIRSNSLGLYAYVQNFPLVGPSRSFPVSSGEVNLGELSFWPTVDWGYAVSDIPTRSSINYRSPETGKSSGNVWYYGGFTNSQYIWKAIPQAADVWARIEDKPGNVYYSPILNLPAIPRVPSQTLSLFDQTVKWEPYALNSYAYYYPTLLKVGTPLSYGYASVYGGVAPCTWSVLSGALPPGITLNSSTGVISGASTQAGVFDSVLRVQDANKVNSVIPLLRFDVRTEIGAEIPTIKVVYPQSRQELYPGGTYTTGWDSFGIVSKTIAINLYKGGVFIKKIAGFAQSAEAGRYYYYWLVPTDLVGGADYSIRISDNNNPALYGESDTFIIIPRTPSIYWGVSKGTYMPQISFPYATSTNPTAISYKLYQQKTGEIAPIIVGTFSAPKCNQSLTSGKWNLYVSCYNWYPTPSWNIHYSTHAPASEFPLGEYTYELKAVDSAGMETSIVNTKTRVFEPVTLLSPLSIDSPLATPTPTFRWTIPRDWPSTVEKLYQIRVTSMCTNTYTYPSGYTYTYQYICTIYSASGLSAPGDTQGFRTYDGPALDPAKKYDVTIDYQRTLLDSTGSAYTSSISMSATSTAFWMSP